MNKLPVLLFLLLGIVHSICSQVDVVYSKLVWSDEFETNGAIDGTKWHHQTLLPDGNGWYNGEEQHYTSRTSNSFASNGLLNIVAIKENFTDQSKTKAYTSARLNSKFAFTYGRVDVRAKLPISKGTWPAIWLLGKNINEPGGFFNSQYGTINWPACGELDIVETGIFPSQPSNYVASAIHTTSSSGSTINKGGVLAPNLGTDFHIYSMNWSPNQITFLLDNVAYYTYNPSLKNASTWPFNQEQYILLNIAMGGVAGAIPASFTQDDMQIDYVRIYQLDVKIPKDSIAPKNLTAKLGTIGSRFIEILVNATDESNTIQYRIKNGSNQVTVSNPSGVEKPITLFDLLPETDYSIEILAADTSGNVTSVPLVLNAKTLNLSSCKGQASSAQTGVFSTGYSYFYETNGNDLTIDYELLDTDKNGVVAFLVTKNPANEYAMTKISGNKFTYKLSGLSLGSINDYAVRFAYSGGNTVSNFFSYTTGQKCTTDNLSISTSSLSSIRFQNPADRELRLQSNETIDELKLYNSMGKIVFHAAKIDSPLDISQVPTGIYQMLIRTKSQITSFKLLKN